MAFDYKKEYKEFYLPPRKPGIVTVPPMNFVSVQGRGDPNEPGGEYQAAMELLYGIAFTIKMSYKGSHKIDGYFEYVVPPLEGLWHQEGVDGVDYAHKECFEWTSMIRLPDFVTREVFDWAVQEPPSPRNLPQRSAPDSTGKIENGAAASCSRKIKSGKFTKTVDFRCEMCYTISICKIPLDRKGRRTSCSMKLSSCWTLADSTIS